jgi:hypothetical protein
LETQLLQHNNKTSTHKNAGAKTSLYVNREVGTDGAKRSDDFDTIVWEKDIEAGKELGN